MLRSVVGRALALAGLGVIVGLVVALVFGGVIRNQLFGVTIFDPTTLAVVVDRAVGKRRDRKPVTGDARSQDRPRHHLPYVRTYAGSSTYVRRRCY